MDEDDCDIFAGVTKFCNSNRLEELIDKAEKDSSEIFDIPLQEFENLNQLNKKSTKGRKSTSKTVSSAKNLEKVSKKTPKKKTRRSKKQTNSEDISETNILSTDLDGPHEGAATRSRRRRKQPEDSGLTSLSTPLPQMPVPPPLSQRGRARRSYMAELAARSSVVGVIDLISSPPLPLPNVKSVISLDSDDDQREVKDLDDSFSSKNPEISVKVNWGGKIERFTHRKYQKFADLMKIFAEREKVGISEIVLNLGDRLIQPSDTPDSISYKISQFIAGRVVKNAINCTRAVPYKKNANEVEVKVQSDAWKKPILVSLKRDDSFRILYIKCSEELKVPCEIIKLSFDGEPLELASTPKDLDFEGGEVIDCRLKR